MMLNSSPPEKTDALQSSLVAPSKWSEDWDLILNPFKSDYFPVGDNFNPAPYLTKFKSVFFSKINRPT